MSDTHSPESSPEPSRVALWNPNAAANWSLLFTPAFGAYLQMLNWRALGKPEAEAASLKWVYASLGFLALVILLTFAIPETKAFDGIVRSVGFGFLFAWYFTSGRVQANYVKEHFGKDYPRKPWTKVLAGGVGFVLAYFVVVFVVVFVLSLFGLLPE